MKRRMSVLGTSQFCGAAAELSQISSGRAAAMGTAFHAACAEDPRAVGLLQALTPEEAEEVCSWHRPAVVEVRGVMLDYAHATVEDEVGLDTQGRYCTADHPDLLTLGHTDMWWHVGGVVYVGDIKKSRWTVDGPDTLQLLSYGYALAEKVGADAFVCGIWAATEGTWTWGGVHDMFSEGAAIWARIQQAANNDDERPNTGQHCQSCYGRPHCPAYLLPAAMADTVLAPFAEGGELTQQNALQVLLAWQAARDLWEKRVKDLLHEYARREGGIHDPNTGKVWTAVETMGRESCSPKKLREAMGKDAEQYISRGARIMQYRWINERG